MNYPELIINDFRDDLDKKHISWAISEIIKTLTEREQEVIYYRFWEELTLQETGKKLQISRERIRQIESKAIRKLRHPTRVSILSGYEIPEAQIAHASNYKWQQMQEPKKEILEQEYLNRKKIWDKEKEKHETYIKNIEKKERDFINTFFLQEKEEIIEEKYKPKPSLHPPYGVQLHWDGEKFILHTFIPYANIDRNRDPETYDRWLNYLIDKHKNKK